MFLGEYLHTLDDKGRVVLPASFRAAIKEAGNQVVLTQGSDGNLALFTPDRFHEVAAEQGMNARTRDVRRDARAWFAKADLQKLDSQGRVMIKDKLREAAGIESPAEVAVVGVYDRIEIWEPTAFVAEQTAADAAFRAAEEVPGI